MTDTVKVKVTDHHFKSHFKVGDVTVTDEEPVEVEPNVTVRNAVQAGTLELVKGRLRPEKDEKEFQEDDGTREESEGLDEKSLRDRTVDDLKDMCEEKDLKKTGTKDELVERLLNQ